ncbi:hypothetical protein PILCRDRAFT_8861 [Piloderma croceum F 1598]|uniref:Uncharacterized protein n=1 Tax=Piloderma croceum (strain F 1598) TaxID=765440 RepID=A0A0C3FPQ9_PILCF|nr:hypothetical protein PILCRDRAFT_8861 [Piloderma croceum F 1598]
MNFTREQLAKNSDYASRKINTVFARMGLQHAKLYATTNTEHAAEDNQWIS